MARHLTLGCAFFAGLFLASMTGPALGQCECECDVNDDGDCNPLDGVAVIDCKDGDCSGCVNSCDLDCDGDVDECDVEAVFCRMEGGGLECCDICGACCCLDRPNWEPYCTDDDLTQEACEAQPPNQECVYMGDGTECLGDGDGNGVDDACPCPCNGDVAGPFNSDENCWYAPDGFVTFGNDFQAILDYINGEFCGFCDGTDPIDRLDVNWSGGVEPSDYEAVVCRINGGGPECCRLPIPAVSEWGLAVMTLLVLTAGSLVFARRRSAMVR